MRIGLDLYPTEMSPIPRLHLCLFVALGYIHLVSAAFTLATSYLQNFIQQNQKGTWCFYPAVGQTRDVSCTGDFTQVSLVHLNTTTSIGYYGPDNTRFGGAEWPVPQVNPGRVTLCVSGQAGDKSFLTVCNFVTSDNSLSLYSGCSIAIGQNRVNDGCYSGQLAANATSSTGPSTPGVSSQPRSIATNPIMQILYALIVASIAIQMIL